MQQSADSSIPPISSPIQPVPVEDPLTAALPPNTDYITYLTILEYQLTPRNLPTLNRLLQEDDGTLAAEIGWDLLKLVLPILRVEPESAKQCLDIIARRGNPREVIVRVAEELENLGQEDEDNEADPAAHDSVLPTFEGEAPRVHLGSMNLQGLPAQEERGTQITQPNDQQEEPDAAVAELKLQALLLMLSALHPRIKTQYPSRFMATSLPAALGAYRRLGMNYETTLTFLNTLAKLAGKKRPALPPRVSTSDILGSAAPLPDPEAKKSSTSSSKEPAEGEATIIQRLLQAVLLEIAEEYRTTSLEAQSPLTAQLRVRLEPDSMISSRRMELDAFINTEEAKQADDIQRRILSVAKDLKLDIAAEISSLRNPALEQPDKEIEEQYDYPTSPAQIPFAPTGLLILYSAQLFAQTVSHKHLTLPNPEPQYILESIDQQYESDARLRQSTAAIDSVLSLLYLIFCLPPASTPLSPTPIRTSPESPLTAPLTRTETVIESQTLLLATHTLLRDIFTTNPDPSIRDNAYHIASHLLHSHCQRETRLHIIRILLETDPTLAISPIHEAQNGNLKAIGVDWLKDELFPTPAVQSMINKLEPSTERGLFISNLDSPLLDLLFPPVSKIEHVPTTSVTEQEKEEIVERFAAELPFYISCLNLLWLLAQQHESTPAATTTASSSDTSAQAESVQQPGTANAEAVLKAGEAMLRKLAEWRTYLVNKLAAGKTATTSTAEEEGGLEIEGIALPDVFAFDDAVTRTSEAMELGLDA